MTQQESTIANADLWSRYFQDQWSQWFNPFGTMASPVSDVAEGTGARVASFLTLVAAGPIAWLYENANTPAARDAGAEPRVTSSELESVEEAAA